jgi:hypothetical protein
MVSLSSRRSTTKSSMPCSRRNSLRWKPSGSFWRIVCSITRGPGKADQRFRLGDVHIAQHGEARRDAAGRRIGEDRDVRQAGAIQPRQRALIFAICISDRAPSIMRAPPEHETMMTGSRRRWRARSRA